MNVLEKILEADSSGSYIASKEELDKLPAVTPEFLQDCKATAEKYNVGLSEEKEL